MQGESEEDMAKYTVDYTSGATGYGWTREYDCLDEFEYFINEKRNDYTAKVTVWDNELQCFIFWKRALSWNCETDMLKSTDRDCRTTTRKRKYVEQAAG